MCVQVRMVFTVPTQGQPSTKLGECHSRCMWYAAIADPLLGAWSQGLGYWNGARQHAQEDLAVPRLPQYTRVHPAERNSCMQETQWTQMHLWQQYLPPPSHFRPLL